jgi:2'-5' RNA ligase
MKYIVHCVIKGPAAKYQKDIANDVYTRFGLDMTKKEFLPAHFTLKYEFEAKSIADMEKVIQAFCDSHVKTSVSVGGFGIFPNAVFLEVRLSKEAQKNFDELMKEFRKLRWLTWSEFDDKNMHFHSTLAKGCKDEVTEIQKFIMGREKFFECYFDNITVLKRVGSDERISKWKLHKTFSIAKPAK